MPLWHLSRLLQFGSFLSYVVGINVQLKFRKSIHVSSKPFYIWLQVLVPLDEWKNQSSSETNENLRNRGIHRAQVMKLWAFSFQPIIIWPFRVPWKKPIGGTCPLSATYSSPIKLCLPVYGTGGRRDRLLPPMDPAEFYSLSVCDKFLPFLGLHR